ncbi:signal peptidase I [Acrocarpospora sp. B8E8]|uniref:signal peptidase I n=1 Tax=Acrocarpospora sp. B8E8 TaxID=3153572 RepID=UPI00325CA02A
MGYLIAGMLVAAVLVARRLLVVVQVAGTSMTPAYHPGDRVLVRRVAGGRLRRGQVVVFQSAHTWGLARPSRLGATDWFIKRVAALPGDSVPDSVAARVDAPPGSLVPARRLVVLGDNPASRDSRAWGYVPFDRVLGVVVRRIHS